MISVLSKQKPELFKIYVYIYIFIFPLDSFSFMMGFLSTILFVWWLCIGKKYGYFIKLKEIFFNIPLLLFILFIFYAYFSLLWTDNLIEGINELKYYKYYWIMIPVLFTAIDKEDIKKIFYLVLLSLGIYALFSLSIFLELINIKGFVKEVPNGHIPYHVVTVYMGVACLFSFYFYLKENNKRIKYILLLISFLSFFALLINNGRIGQISFFVTLLVISIYYWKNIYKYKKTLIFIILTVLFSISLMFHFNKTDRYLVGIGELKHSYNTGIFKGSWGTRLFMWNVAKEYIPKHLIFGAGVGDTFDEIKEFVKLNPNKLLHHTVGYHNQHLDYLAKYGLFGYLLFLMFIFLLLKNLYFKNKEFFTLGLMFFSFILIDGFGDVILSAKPFNNIYCLIIILFAVLISDDKKNICNKNLE